MMYLKYETITSQNMMPQSEACITQVDQATLHDSVPFTEERFIITYLYNQNVLFLEFLCNIFLFLLFWYFVSLIGCKSVNTLISFYSNLVPHLITIKGKS